MTTKRFIGDFETRSRCDLKKAGAYKYSKDPTTQPTCFAFKIRGNPKVYFLPFETINTPWRDLPPAFKTLWSELYGTGYLFVAHNAFFERCIYENILVERYGWPSFNPLLFRCTAAKAAACALPRNLEGAGEAMNLRVQKDKRGYVAMMATCKPTKEWNAWNKLQAEVKMGKRLSEKKLIKSRDPEPEAFLEPMPSNLIEEIVRRGPRYDTDPEYKRASTWKTLYDYCKIDVRAEEELDIALPDLNPMEQEIWFLNQKLNWRGLRIDIPTVKKITGIIEAESKVKLKELDTLTMGLVTKPGARRSILEFLALDGIVLPDIKSKTVEDALKGGKLSPDMQTLLELRKALSMTSTRKYQSFLNRANVEDDRVRDILMYHGASTGRDTGTGVQPHNFPRGVIKVSKNRPYAAVENVVNEHPEMLKILYGESLSMLFSSILRNMIIPSEGKELFVADFSKIEVAVLWWLSDNWAGLQILKEGKDPYIYQAARNLGKTYEEVGAGVQAEEPWAMDARQLGKAQILGCGFGMGAPKFQTTAYDMYRLKLNEEQAKDAVDSYREANAAVPLIWKMYEQAAIKAIEDKVVVKIGKCRFFVKDRFLWIELPSGRRLAYRNPQISWRETIHTKNVVEYKYTAEGKTKVVREETYTVSRKTIEFWAVNSKTKKWSLERTWGGTLTENIVQAVARDLMMEGAVRLEKNDYQFLLAVHDEGICERNIGEGSVEEFTKLLCQRPAWADEHLPLEAKGWNGPRYRK